MPYYLTIHTDLLHLPCIWSCTYIRLYYVDKHHISSLQNCITLTIYYIINWKIHIVTLE